MFIKANSAWMQIDLACVLLEVSRSSYYEWISTEDARIKKLQAKQKMANMVFSTYSQFKGRYGATRIMQTLGEHINCNYKQIAKIMQELGIQALGHKKYKVTTNSNHKLKVFDNLLNRNFAVDRPNVAWVGDITYIRTNEGWLYLATVIDLHSRKIIGYSMSSRMTCDLVISALLKALKARNYPKGVIVHSDRGSQYASNEYKKILRLHNLKGSMSKKGDCWDNAVAESFFATLKKEYVYHTEFRTRIDAHLGIFDFIEAWYNQSRIHSYLNGLSPNEFECKYSSKYINMEVNNRDSVRLSIGCENSK